MIDDIIGPVPPCLELAYGFLAEDRAVVACIPTRDGEVITLASNMRRWEVAQNPKLLPAVLPSTPRSDRALTLLTGLRALVRNLL